MTGDTPSFGTEDALRLVLSERRRAVLRYLLAASEPVVSLSELATAVRLGADDGRFDQASVEAVLHHVDLPKLDATGVIYDDTGNNQVLCPDTEPVAELVELIDEQFE